MPALEDSNLYLDFGPEIVPLSLRDGDPDEYWHEYEGRILAEDVDEGTVTELGQVRLNLIEIDCAEADGVPAWEIIEGSTQANADFLGVLYDLETMTIRTDLEDQFDLNMSGLLMVHEIGVYPEFRGRGLGLLTLRCCIDYFSKRAGWVLLKAFPLQFHEGDPANPEFTNLLDLPQFSKNKKTSTAKLIDYYSKVGFEQIDHTPFCLLNTCLKQPPLPDTSFCESTATHWGFPCDLQE